MYATFGGLQINDPVDVAPGANFMSIKWLQFTQTLYKIKIGIIFPLSHCTLYFPFPEYLK